MKGTYYNGSSIASKGCTASEAGYYLSIGNLVAFKVDKYSSPDGRSGYRRGYPLEYFLEKEISLETFDHTKVDKYGSGKYDCQRIEQISNVWKFVSENWQQFGGDHTNYLCEILKKTDECQLEERFLITSHIVEVRENPGFFLHVYTVDDADFSIAEKSESFTEAIEKIQKNSLKLRAENGLKNWRRGGEFPIWITKKEYYAPKVGVGGDGSDDMHWYGGTSGYWMRIDPSVKAGSYSLRVKWYPVQLYVPEDPKKHPSLNVHCWVSWANKQSYDIKYDTVVDPIKPGQFFIDCKDIYEENHQVFIEQQVAIQAAKKARSEKFKKLSTSVREKHGEKVLKLALKKKGQVLATLSTLNNVDFEPKFLEKMLKITNNKFVMENIFSLIENAINPRKAGKIAKKAYAWAYIMNAFPLINFVGYFDEALKALSIYSKNFSWEVYNKKSKNYLGDYFPDSLKK